MRGSGASESAGLDRFLSRVVRDPGFRRMLSEDPERAAEGVGLQLTEGELQALNEIWRACGEPLEFVFDDRGVLRCSAGF